MADSTNQEVEQKVDALENRLAILEKQVEEHTIELRNVQQAQAQAQPVEQTGTVQAEAGQVRE